MDAHFGIKCVGVDMLIGATILFWCGCAGVIRTLILCNYYDFVCVLLQLMKGSHLSRISFGGPIETLLSDKMGQEAINGILSRKYTSICSVLMEVA